MCDLSGVGMSHFAGESDTRPPERNARLACNVHHALSCVWWWLRLLGDVPALVQAIAKLTQTHYPDRSFHICLVNGRCLRPHLDEAALCADFGARHVS